MEEQIKEIKEELPSIKSIEPEKTETKEPNKEVINTLPEWSIEPPLKINRGQK